MMQLFARIDWANKERTRGKVILLWRCPEHRCATRAGDLNDPPPPCPMCAGMHYQLFRKTKKPA